MKDKNKLIEQLIQEKGGTREQYLSLLDKIAHHETGGSLDPTTVQRGGGPGRGKYQFEIGKHEGGITAANRTKNYLEEIGEKVPQWLKEATKGNSLDASQLTSEQQDMLFLGNMRKHPTADFSDVWSGEESVESFWANNHWAGDDEDRSARINSFRSSMSNFNEPDYANLSQEQPHRYPSQQEQRVATRDNIPQQQITRQQLAPQQDFTQQDVFQYMQQKQQPQVASQERTIQGPPELNEFNAGGKHEENPLGGVPIGMGSNGKPNTVEEGETSFDIEGDKFIFSDRVTLTDYIKDKNNKSANTFAFGGKTNGGTDPTDPPTVNFGTKEYEKAYKEGRFANLPNQLDEVVITADGKTGQNIKEDYPNYDSLSEQDKKYWNDSSPIGRSVRRRARTSKGLAGDALRMGPQLLQGALAGMQMPQSAMVEGIEAIRGNPSDISNALPGGNQRVPSDAWGYQNPEGILQHGANLGMDILADPTNLVGAGYADDAARGVRVITGKYDNYINKKALESISRGGDKLSGKATRAAVLPKFQKAREKAIQSQVDDAIKLHEDIVGDPSILEGYFSKKQKITGAISNYNAQRTIAAGKYARRLQKEKAPALPIAQDFSDYFSYLEKEKGIKLFRNNKKGKKQLEELLGNEKFVDKFIEAQSHGQRAVSKIDKSLSSEEKREILDHYFTNAGNGWLPNSLYSSNSEFISDRFSSVSDPNLEEGYVADLKFNFPGLEGKTGREKLQAYRDLVRLDTQPNFRNETASRNFPIYQANYGDYTSAERIITDEFLKDNPNFITVKSIKRNTIEDRNAHLKMGKMGTKDAQGSPNLFHHDSSLPYRYSKSSNINLEDIREVSTVPNFLEKATKKMKDKEKKMEANYQKTKEAKKTFHDKMKEEGYPPALLGKDGKIIEDNYTFKRLEDFNIRGKARFKDDVKAIGILGTGSASVVGGGKFMYDSYKNSRDKRLEDTKQAFAEQSEKTNTLKKERKSLREATLDIDVDIRDASKFIRSNPEYKEKVELYRNEEDPVKKLELDRDLAAIKYRLTNQYKDLNNEN